MENVLDFLTLARVIGILLFFSSLWLARIFLKKDRRNFFRGMILFLFFLLVMIYINQNDRHTLTLGDLRDMVFPQHFKELNYRVVPDTGTDQHITTYYFDNPKPKLSVVLDADGKHLHIRNPASLNKILNALGLPEVEEGAQELSSITGSKLDTSLYRWANYPLGILLVEKTIYQSRDAVQYYHAIANISIHRRR
jgi:hypothetical protein